MGDLYDIYILDNYELRHNNLKYFELFDLL